MGFTFSTSTGPTFRRQMELESRSSVFAFVNRLSSILIKANKQFDLLIMPGETHETDNIWGGYGLDAELRYFKEHLNP